MPDTKQFGNAGDEVNGSDRTLKPNTLLMGRYRILGVLGGGGMGTVYKARDMHFPDVQRHVAVKEMLTFESSSRASTIATFKREADLLASLSHPAIPKIYEFFDTGDRAYVIMEHINGSDLEMLLSKTRELPVDKVIEWSIELCDVLDYLHSHKPNPIIFRDLKPANIMIDSFGKVRLIDFGIAKVFIDNKTKKHTMIGTEGYSAPEQYRGEPTVQSDIYGLGATLHHILTRQDPRLELPFSFSERPIEKYNPNVPQAFIDIINRALDAKPELRWLSCADMRRALDQLRMGNMRASAEIPAAVPPLAAQPAAKPSDPIPSAPPAPPSEEATSFFKDLKDTGNLEARWMFRAEDEIRAGASTFQNFVFVGSYDTNIWGLNATNGEFLWKHSTGAGIATIPIVDASSKLVLCGSEDTTFYALDMRNGRLAWTFNTKGKIRSTARAAHDHVFFGSDDGKVYALVAQTGRLLWEHDMGSPVRSRPFVTNDIVVISAEMGDVHSLELSGKRKWSFRVKRGMNSSPYVDIEENVCYVTALDGFLYAIDASSGYSMWKLRTEGAIYSSPVSDSTNVYFGSTDGRVYAVNSQTGKERWRFETGQPVVGSPVVYQDAVIIGSTDGALYCINTRTGKQMWKYQTQGKITATPTIFEKMVLIGSLDKTLYALPLAI